MTKDCTGIFRCLLCGGNAGYLFLSNVPDCYLGRGVLSEYWQCYECNLVQQHPFPIHTNQLYADYPVHHTKSVWYETARKLLLKPVYFPLAKVTPVSKVLDYGCGDGGYLGWLHGRTTQLAGFEIDPAQARRVKDRLGVSVFSDFATLKSAHPDGFDIITMHFVLEHLSDPLGTLDLLTTLLLPGGTIFATVPHLDCWEYRLFKRRWHGLDAPRHLSFPEQEHAESMGRRCGLTTRISFVPFPNTFAASMATLPGWRFRSSLFALYLIPGLFASRIFSRNTMAIEWRKDIRVNGGYA